ncbi:DUF808 domain-containing protein [Brevibacterium litoralis]|uniref:DUF808 domain-containing protein n=1 Tax=Brevibacterium litoralis TaxID=3138935 RepID=UPI0032EB92BD
MAGGLVALLDDVAAIARTAAASVDDIAAGAAKASSKAAGVVIDDAAVTPQFLTGAKPNRELPIIWAIAKGSIVNKLIIIVAALLISMFTPWWVIPVLLLAAGSYLCFEGAEKVIEKARKIAGRPSEVAEEKKVPATDRGPEAERTVIRGAVTTDFILSCEIMVISLKEVLDEPLLTRALILVVVAIAITVLVYGAVALIIRMDDIGLHMTTKDSAGAQRVGRALVVGMPHVLTVISVVGTLAMLWVGGHIVMIELDELGFHAVYGFVHGLEEPLHHVAAIGGLLAWLVNTAFSLAIGLVWGSVLAGIVHVLPFGGKH